MKWRIRRQKSGVSSQETDGSKRSNESVAGSQDDKSMMKDKVAKGVAKIILKMQSGFAKFMGQHTAKVSSFGLKVWLAVFFLSGSSLSIYFIFAAFSKKEQSKTIKIDRLSVPSYYNKNGDEPVQPDFFISKREYEEMLSFKNYMDSLHRSKGSIYDSIMLNRPGLMDSVNKLEQIYQQQVQNKK